MISKIYIAASSRDARFARICAASVRSYYPDLPVYLLPGGELACGLAAELRSCWNIELADIPPGDYGWGFVKLEPLFGPPGEPFLMLDADTVMTGPVLESINRHLSSPDKPCFLVDEEDQPEAEMRRLYYDWDKVIEFDSEARRPAFVFNSGQWVGTPGLLSRKDFDRWVEWSPSPDLRHPDVFMPGDQGVLNYVLNQGHTSGRLRVTPFPLMCWPGHGMEGFSAVAVCDGIAPARIVHWAGLKRLRLSSMPGADLLAHFEQAYYGRVPGGCWLRPLRNILGSLDELLLRLRTRVRLFWRCKIRRIPA